MEDLLQLNLNLFKLRKGDGQEDRWIYKITSSSRWSFSQSSSRSCFRPTRYEDKSFDFIVKTTPASILIKKAAGLDKGSGTPNSLKVGKVTRTQLEEIAKVKDVDLTAANLDAAVRTLEGSARSAGIEVEG